MSGNIHRLALVPRDGFFCKDGRGWSTSARTNVLDWPWPTTVRGALTTASGKLIESGQPTFTKDDWEKHQQGVKLRRLLTLRRLHDKPWSPAQRMWPVPADALWIEGAAKVFRLKPSSSGTETGTLGRAVDPIFDSAREALWAPHNLVSNAKPLASPRWWDEACFMNWLCGEDVMAKQGDTPHDKSPADAHPRPRSRMQVHVGIKPDTLTSDEGILFAHDVIETLEKNAEWAIGAEVSWPTNDMPPMARLGSDSRLTFVDPDLPANVFAIPEKLRTAFTPGSPGLRLIVTSPTLFPNEGWLPDAFAPAKIDAEMTTEIRGNLAGFPHELILRAAFVPRPQHISGWDMAKESAEPPDGKPKRSGAPRATGRFVAPGAVYYFERVDKKRFDAGDAETLWSTSIGSNPEIGFGCVVPGVWDPKDKS